MIKVTETFVVLFVFYVVLSGVVFVADKEDAKNTTKTPVLIKRKLIDDSLIHKADDKGVYMFSKVKWHLLSTLHYL